MKIICVFLGAFFLDIFIFKFYLQSTNRYYSKFDEINPLKFIKKILKN